LTCNRVAILHEGQIVREGELANLLRPTTELHVAVDAVTPALIEAVRPLVRSVRTNGASLEVELEHAYAVPAVARAVHDAGAELWELTPRQESLEDVFIGVVRSQS
jgi:ABC-2 type transport system ATP-binding protein